MFDLSQLLAVLILYMLGMAAGWFWHRSRGKIRLNAGPNIASQLNELQAIGELSVFKAVSKDILTQVDHSVGEFGRKYLGWAFSKIAFAAVQG